MRRRRGTLAAGPLAAVSMALMALPAAWTQPPRLVLSGVLSPFARAPSSLGHGLAGGGTRTAAELQRDLDYEMSKNLEMGAKIAKLQEQIEALTAARQTIRDPKLTTVAAGVVVQTDSSMWRRTFVIDAGSGKGIRQGQAVLWHNHLIGFVGVVGPWSSRVALITDPKVVVGAMAVARATGGASLPGRDLCVLEGTGGAMASLKWASADATAGDGATVVTSPDPHRGIPEGLLLGRVTGVSRVRGPFACPQVQPFVDIRGVDSVLVLVKIDP
ncbi:MAG TPA: rod shape-determining protein MreC [Planctomycetota bacterium]